MKKTIIAAATVLCFLVPLNADSTYNFARSLFLNNNFSIAGGLFEMISIERPDSGVAGSAEFMRAESLYNTGRFTQALTAYNDVMDKHPAMRAKYKKELYFRIAECYFQLKDYPGALKYAGIILDEYKGSYLEKDAKLMHGEALFLTGEYDAAINELSLLNNYTDYRYFDYMYYLMGRIYYEKALADEEDRVKNAKESVKYFERIKAEFPKSSIIRHSEFRRAGSYYLLEEYNKSLSICLKLLKEDSPEKYRLLVAYFTAWNYYMLSEYEKAIEYYNNIINDYDDRLLSAWSEYKKGMCFEALGEKEKALEQYGLVTDKYPSTIPSAYAEYAKGFYYYREEEYYDALDVFEKSLKEYNIEELNRAAYYMMGDIYANLGKYARAKEVYEKLEKADERDAVKAAYMQAWCFSKLTRFDESTAIYESLLAGEDVPAAIKAKCLLKTGDNYYEQGLTKTALDFYDRALKDYPKEKETAAEAQYGKGWVYYSGGDFKKAANLFKGIKAVSCDGRMLARADFMIANTFYSGGRFGEALNIYRGLMDNGGADAAVRNESMYYAAWCLYRADKFQEAIRLWEKYTGMVKDSVKKADARYRIGWAYFRQNDYDSAIKEFNVILEKYKNLHFYQEALLKTGDCYYNKGDFENAVVNYKKLVENFPEHYRVGEALYGVQWSYYRLGKNEEAIKLSKEFVEKFPESTFTPEILYRVAEHYYNMKRYGTAINEFMKFLGKYPDNSLADNAYYWLGAAYSETRSYNDAINTFKELMEKYPKSHFITRAIFKTAGAYYKIHDYVKSIEYNKMLIDGYKDSKFLDNAYFNTAMSFKRLDDTVNAAMWYKMFIEKFKDSPLNERAHLNLAYLYQDEKKYDEAIKVFRETVRMKGKKAAEAQFWIADCYKLKKDYKKAINEYLKLYENFPEEEIWVVSGLDSAAKLYEKNGSLKSAIKMYKRVLKVTKNPRYTETAKKKIELLQKEYELLQQATPAETKGTGAKK